MHDISDIIKQIYDTVKSHDLGNGAYSRYTPNAEFSKAGANEYGCADAANILYTIGKFPGESKVRAQCVRAINNFQHPDGLFDEKTHHPIHCTAHCIAALELFDASPRFPLQALQVYRSREGLRRLLSQLDWTDNPWPAAHAGSGIFAAFVLTGNADRAWQNNYFSWLDEHVNPNYGIGLKNAVEKKAAPLSHHLFGWFHYLFNYLFARRAFPYAEQLIDSCLALYSDHRLPDDFGKSVNFQEMDWVFSLHRATSQTGYRIKEAKEQLRDFAKKYFNVIRNFDISKNERWDDLHLLFGLTCTLAELQLALPGEIATEYPLKCVLDRRPFI